MVKLKKLTETGGGVVLLIVAIVALNVIASRVSGRIDVTEDEVFSLSPGTEKILQGLKDDVDVKLYFSRSIKNLPVLIKTYATRVEEVLHEYAARSGGKLEVEVIDPEPDTDAEEWARKYGISAVRLPDGAQLYFGLVFLRGSQEITVPYLDPRREEFLEYDVSEALVSLFREEKPKVGVISSLGVMGSPHPYGMGEPWVFITDLKKNFDVEEIPAGTVEISDDYRAVLVIHPKAVDDKIQYALDQYLMRGGRLVIAVDPMSRMDLAHSGHARAMGQMPDVSSDLPKLFAAWGLTYSKADLVGDAGQATTINVGGQAVVYPYFLTLGEAVMNDKAVITGDLKHMIYAEGGFIELSPESKLAFTPLLETTDSAGQVSASLANFMMPDDLARELKTDGKKRTLAGLLTGKFVSAFEEPPVSLSEEDRKKLTKPHKRETDGEGSVLVIADTDFLSDGNAVDKLRFGSQMLVRVRNDNLNFVFNAVDFLAGSPELISIRSRGRIARPFTRVQELQKQAQLKWKSQEDELTEQLQKLQQELNELQRQRTDGNRFVLTSEQQDRIKKFREEERQIRQRRREVRKNLREDIEALGKRLIAANMLIVPLAVSGFGVGVFVTRSRRMRKGRKHGQ